MNKFLLAVCALTFGTTMTSHGQTSGVVRIWPLGDSITGGYEDYGSYRRNLWMMLRAVGHRVEFVGTITQYYEGEPEDLDFDASHDGHWAWRTDEILEKADTWAMKLKPDMVLIHLGTNDRFNGRTIGDIVADLRELITKIRVANPSATFLVAQIIPNASSGGDLVALNREIEKLAALSTEGSPVVIVDQYSGFVVETDTWDGLHPNQAGSEKMAVRWFEAVNKNLALLPGKPAGGAAH
jgi:hypothetical protein